MLIDSRVTGRKLLLVPECHPSSSGICDESPPERPDAPREAGSASRQSRWAARLARLCDIP